jgi:hypothetical protein
MSADRPADRNAARSEATPTAALVVARADDPAATRAQVGGTLRRLLERLRT